MPTMTMIESIRDAMRSEMESDEKVLVLGQDVGKLGGVFRATDGFLKEFGPDRVVEMPLAEAVIVASALGLALSGLKPIAEIQFLGFLHQAFHHVGPQVGRMRYRSQGRFSPQMVIRAPFGGGVRTPEHHSDATEAQFAQSPGIKVVMPATAYDAKGLLLEAIRDPDPVLFCEPLRGYRLVKDEVPSDDYTVPFGELRVAREGTDVTLVAWSAAVQVCERAAKQLDAEGISAEVLDLRTLVPLDEANLVKAVQSTGRAVVVHEAPLTAGFGAEVVSVLQENAFYSLEAPIARVTGFDTPYPLASLEDYYIPSAERVVKAVRKTVQAA